MPAERVLQFCSRILSNNFGMFTTKHRAAAPSASTSTSASASGGSQPPAQDQPQQTPLEKEAPGRCCGHDGGDEGEEDEDEAAGRPLPHGSSDLGELHGSCPHAAFSGSNAAPLLAVGTAAPERGGSGIGLVVAAAAGPGADEGPSGGASLAAVEGLSEAVGTTAGVAGAPAGPGVPICAPGSGVSGHHHDDGGDAPGSSRMAPSSACSDDATAAAARHAPSNAAGPSSATAEARHHSPDAVGSSDPSGAAGAHVAEAGAAAAAAGPGSDREELVGRELYITASYFNHSCR